MSHKGARGPAVPRTTARGRWVRVEHCRTRQPPTPFPGGSRAATAGAEARERRGRERAAPPLCPPAPPPSPAQRGGGSATAVPIARGPRPKPGTIGGGAQSPPCPPPSPPRSPPRRNMAARPPLPPSRTGPPAPLSPDSGWAKVAPHRSRGQPGPVPRTTAREVASPARGLPTRVNKAHEEWGWRPGRAAPSSCAPRPPTRTQSLGARELPPTSHRPPARRYLVGAPPPGPRPAPCAATAAALFWRRFNSRPREKLSLPGTTRPACSPSPGRGASLALPFPEGPLCSPRAHPPAGAAQEGSARVPGAAAARTPPPPTLLPPALPLRQPACERIAAATRRGGQRPETRPGHAAAAAATLPRAIPPHPPARPPHPGRTQQVSLTRRRGGQTHQKE